MKVEHATFYHGDYPIENEDGTFTQARSLAIRWTYDGDEYGYQSVHPYELELAANINTERHTYQLMLERFVEWVNENLAGGPEYRLCVRRYGHTARYAKRDLKHAEKGLDETEEHLEGLRRRGFLRPEMEPEAWIETRTVTGWERIEQ